MFALLAACDVAVVGTAVDVQLYLLTLAHELSTAASCYPQLVLSVVAAKRSAGRAWAGLAAQLLDEHALLFGRGW